jgi:hypothetical protein
MNVVYIESDGYPGSWLMARLLTKLCKEPENREQNIMRMSIGVPVGMLVH